MRNYGITEEGTEELATEGAEAGDGNAMASDGNAMTSAGVMASGGAMASAGNAMTSAGSVRVYPRACNLIQKS